MSINELAKQCNVSRTTIMRFCQKLGFDGFSEFKYHLKMNLHRKMCVYPSLRRKSWKIISKQLRTSRKKISLIYVQ
ncbi:hypothetical protein SNF32_15765 [Enterococcus mundtii]|nr:hypothetical protein [Enterococcus mundtii]